MDYIDFELAKSLKEIGFNFYIDSDIIIDYYFDPKGQEIYWEEIKRNMEYIPRAHLYDVQKWLRNKHNINIEISIDVKGFAYEIWDINTLVMIGSDAYFSSYEITLLNSIKTSINFIKDGKKD